MNRKNCWQVFFDFYAPKYMDEPFTSNTTAEVDFLLEELELDRSASILDVGCGTGRHVLELARRGYSVVGIDISENMLSQARSIRDREGLEAEFIRADATEFRLERTFSAAICLCEGAFGLLSEGEDPFKRDQRILTNIAAVLAPGSPLVLTVLNGLRMIRSFGEEDVDSGRFDPLAIVETHALSELHPEAPDDILVREKGFLATELVQMLNAAGFRVDAIWGGTAGEWRRERPKLDEMELMVKSTKE